MILNGDHNHLHVIFELPVNLLDYIPESLLSGEAIKLNPVVFNTCLQEVAADDSCCQFEQDMNGKAMMELKSFYRGLRYHDCYYLQLLFPKIH